jgi:hypothetical protein
MNGDGAYIAFIAFYVVCCLVTCIVSCGSGLDGCLACERRVIRAC